ncbi:hypothetical protein DMUE_5068 [Dictyocoela muelleri]|nr:hypothetical protein DMUE_5068 [Dictyocoela muelleri]
MTIIYKNESNFRACVKVFLAFSFLPKTKIPSMINSFESYISKFDFHESIMKIWNFFKCVYLRLDLNNLSVFSYEFWSAPSRVSSKISLTTNCLEMWHRSFNSHFQLAHPNINTLLNGIHIEHNVASIKIIQLLYENLPEVTINMDLTNIINNCQIIAE